MFVHRRSALFVLSILLFIAGIAGCGSESNVPKYIKAPDDSGQTGSNTGSGEDQNDSQPQTPTIPREVTVTHDSALSDTDWGASVELRACYDTQKQKMTFEAYSPAGVSDDTFHYQFFLDIDKNPQTGFTSPLRNDYYALEGIDFMIEDGAVYRALSTSQWQWEKVADYDFIVGKLATGEVRIQNCGSLAAFGTMFDINTTDEINMAMMPAGCDWEDVGNFVKLQNVRIGCR